MAVAEGSTASKKRKLVDFSEAPVTILVGREKKSFSLHPSIVSNSSKFFLSSFSGRWMIGDNINLPDVEPPTFQIYAGYVYTGEIGLPLPDEDDLPLQDVKKGTSTQPRFEALVKLYVLANMLEDKALRNTVMDKMQDWAQECHNRPGTTCINMAFTATHDSSTLCRYLLDSFLAATDPQWLETAWTKLPPVFITALMLGWAKSSWDRSVERKRPREMPKCTYHEHGDEVPMDDSCAQGFAEQKPEPKTPKKPAKRSRVT